MGMEEFSVSMTNRSLRTIKTELEFLAENSVITQSQLSTMLGQLPSETIMNGTSTTANSNNNNSRAPTAALNNLNLHNETNNNNERTSTPSYNEKQQQNGYYDSQPAQPPPAYNSSTPVANSIPPPPPPSAPQAPLAHAVSMYAYAATDAGDLNLQPNDRVVVTEYMNAEWWKGRNERTGQEGIFPRTYVRVEEKNIPPPMQLQHQPSNYGNMPLDVAQSSNQQPQQQQVGPDGKVKGTAQKIGGKLGNAAIFGAGATIGSNLVNSIF